jgi:hypothetical protein
MSRLDQFEMDIARAKDLVGLGQSIGSMTSGIVDASDLYRAALVQAVAAWDRYIHGLVLDRAVDIVLGRLDVQTTHKIGLGLSTIRVLMQTTNPAEQELVARSLVADRLTRETFQRPDDVGSALAMVGIRAIWSTAFEDAGQAKIAVGVIVDRRNRIVHACDCDPVQPGSVLTISSGDAQSAIGVLENTASAVHSVCTSS